MPKKLKGGPFGIFLHPFCRKNKKLKGALLGKIFRKKSRNAEQNKGGPFSLSRYGLLRGTFLVQFARPNESIWDHKIV